MAGFDTSNVAAQVGQGVAPPPANAMQTVEGLANLQNSLNQNKMFQAKALAGQYLAASTGPNGQPDVGKLNMFLQHDPRTAPYAAEILQGGANIQGQGIQNQQGGANLAQSQYQNLQRDISTYGNTSQNKDPAAQLIENQRAAAQAVAQGVAAGRYPAAMASQYLGGNTASSFSDDVRAATIAGAGGAGAQTAMTGTPTLVDTGPTTSIQAVNPYRGTSDQIGSVEKGLSPEAAASLHEVVDPTSGVHKLVPTSAIVTPQGQPKPNVPGLTDASGALTASLPPGAAEARATTGQASGAQYASELADASGSGQRIAVLKKVEDLLQTPEGKTGPGTQVVSGWRNFLLANAPILAGLVPGGLDEAKLQSATQDQIKKYMVQVAGNAASQFGPGTNEKLAVAASGNANPDLSNLANQDVTRMNIALERAKQARLAAFEATGEPAERYSTWASTWNRTVDPRAFMLDILTPAERAKMLGEIKSPADKKAMISGKKAAEAAGLFQESDIPR